MKSYTDEIWHPSKGSQKNSGRHRSSFTRFIGLWAFEKIKPWQHCGEGLTCSPQDGRVRGSSLNMTYSELLRSLIDWKVNQGMCDCDL